MPFGLCNALATFQRLMAQALTSVTKKYGNIIMCYVDDVVIATPTLEDQIERLDEVFTCMKQAGLKCKPSKCEILRDSIKYLGRLADKLGVRPDPEAVEAVLTWKAPKTDTQVMSFLGFTNSYEEFVKGYADKIYPMQQLMRNKGKKFTWTDEAQGSFENLKCELCEAPVLGMPTEKGMFVLDTDASVVAISGILHQEQEWNGRTVLHPIAYGNKETYDKLPPTRWLIKSGHPIPGHYELPVETAAEIKFLARGEAVPLDMLVPSNLVQQELTRLGINSIALLNKRVNVAPDVMGQLSDLLDREVDRNDREWMETMQRLTVTEKTEKRPVIILGRDVERDCRSIVNQLMISMPKDVLLRTSFIERGRPTPVQVTERVRVKSKSSFTRKVHFTDVTEEYDPSSDCSSWDETMSGESDTSRPVQDDLSGRG
ncbi:uncharacterized protein LOC134855080 [Symsagittifera roscoffensis]|uniref:uncharacterized protein LOC134855080 n=1 Tax=Symsagittifera roscoffensis TaxID=84072 RepID=UPI00307C6924